jgi:hypothetical protein
MVHNKSISVIIRIESETKDKLKAIADELDVTASALIINEIDVLCAIHGIPVPDDNIYNERPESA